MGTYIGGGSPDLGICIMHCTFGNKKDLITHFVVVNIDTGERSMVVIDYSSVCVCVGTGRTIIEAMTDLKELSHVEIDNVERVP